MTVVALVGLSFRHNLRDREYLVGSPHTSLLCGTAVRQLSPDKVGDENLKHFKQTVRLTSRLTHPNTVTIYDRDPPFAESLKRGFRKKNSDQLPQKSKKHIH